MAYSNSVVCFSTSFSVVLGHIKAMLWNGVIKMPRFNMKRCMYSSRRSSLAFIDSPPLLGAGFTKRYSALAPSWLIDQGISYLVSRLWTYFVNFVQSFIIRSKASSVNTVSRVVRIAAIERALPAKVPPIPPTSTRSTFFALMILSATSWVTPKAPHGIPPPMLLPMVIISGLRFIALVAPPYPALNVWVSSLINKVPCLADSDRTNSRNPGSGNTIPIFVIAGYIKTAATSLFANYFLSASKSLNSTTLVVKVGLTEGATSPGLSAGFPFFTTTKVSSTLPW